VHTLQPFPAAYPSSPSDLQVQQLMQLLTFCLCVCVVCCCRWFDSLSPLLVHTLQPFPARYTFSPSDLQVQQLMQLLTFCLCVCLAAAGGLML
jgi:hypothetical protein